METASLRMPGEVICGTGSTEKLKEIMEQNDFKKIVILTDKMIRQAGLTDGITKIISDEKIAYEIIDELMAEPTVEQAEQVINAVKQIAPDFIIAIGGGSVMDQAKLCSILRTDKYDLKQVMDHPGIAKKVVKTLMIPTTAGTGAEATPNSIVTVEQKQLKVGIVNYETIADYVILDANMIKNIPFKIAASTGVDALAHAIECFTGNKATAFSDMYALEALKIIFQYIEDACRPEGSMEAKQKMLLAAFYGGVSIAASGTTAVHALSYPLGGRYHIPHGVSNAILLVPVMKFNEPYIRDRFGLIYDAVNEERNIPADDKSKWVLKRLEEIVVNLEIPTKLSSFGVDLKDLSSLVDAGMQVTRLLNNNMREVTREDAETIYKQILDK